MTIIEPLTRDEFDRLIARRSFEFYRLSLRDAYRRPGIAEVHITFDGCGDQIVITAVDYYDWNRRKLSVPRGDLTALMISDISVFDPLPRVRRVSLDCVEGHFVYNALVVAGHPCWGDGPGSEGTMLFDVTSGRLRIEYQQPVETCAPMVVDILKME